MAVHAGKAWAELKERAPHVIIVNLDLSGSSLVAKVVPTEWEMLTFVNALQDQIDKCFLEASEKEGWLVGEWSGDGLVSLYLDEQDKPDPAVKVAVAIPDIVGKWRADMKQRFPAKAELLERVDVRIGMRAGRIHWLPAGTPTTGRIISPRMNEAGHIQKECDPGTVLIDEDTYSGLSAELKENFPAFLKRRIKHGETDIDVYTFKKPVSPSSSPSQADIEDRILANLAGSQRIAKAPGACYFFGEFAVMFGHMALIQPIPMYTYIGTKIHGPNKQATKIELEAAFAVKRELELFDPDVRRNLNLDNDFVRVEWSVDERDQINRIARAILGPRAGTHSLTVYSLIPQKCGLNASSAVSMALSAVLLPDRMRALQERLSTANCASEFYGDSGDEFSRLIRAAWAFDNVFHGGSSSGCGITAAAMGAPDGWPIIYVAESRGFQGPYPIAFDDLDGDIAHRSWEPLRRIRFIAHPVKRLRIDNKGALGLEHQFALFHIDERKGGLSTKDIINQFLSASNVSGDIVKDIKGGLDFQRRQMHKYYIPSRLVAEAIEMLDYGDLGSFMNKKGDKITRLSEMLVESLATALGACALSGISSFARKGFHDKHWTDFAQCMNAYQELMCACGVSQPLADLFNYRSDAFAHEFTEKITGDQDGPEVGRSAPHSEQEKEKKKKIRLPYGTKLTGAGLGGDFLVVAPRTHLSDNFQTFRHEVRIDHRALPCHFASWRESARCQGAELLRIE